MEGEEEDEDDWDAFQSFPATANVAATTENAAEESGLNEKSFQELSTSHSINYKKDKDDAEFQDSGKDEVISCSPGSTRSKDDISDPYNNENQKLEEEAMPEDQCEEEGSGIVQISSDLQSAKDIEGPTGVNLVEGGDHEFEGVGDTIDCQLSPDNLEVAIDQESIEESVAGHGQEEDTAYDKVDIPVSEALPPQNDSENDIDGAIREAISS